MNRSFIDDTNDNKLIDFITEMKRSFIITTEGHRALYCTAFISSMLVTNDHIATGDTNSFCK